MCGDIQVYNITDNLIINPLLCPFKTDGDIKYNYEKWRSNRVYLKSNRVAEQIVKQTGGSKVRESKRRLSLSDSFWVKYPIDKHIKFENITPYFNDFSSQLLYGGKSSSTPELVLSGSQPKQWIRNASLSITYMRKAEFPEQVHVEMLAVKLARAADIPVMNAFVETNEGKRIYADDYSVITNAGTINLVNMTNPCFSLIQFDQMNIGVNGLNPANIIEAYKRAGVKYDVRNEVLRRIIFDGIVGNIDREYNNSNWAVFMCNESGERHISPMYDFNWTNISGESQVAEKIAVHVKKNGFSKEAAEITSELLTVCENLGFSLWKSNAEKILSII
jgi:hypothetical protein